MIFKRLKLTLLIIVLLKLNITIILIYYSNEIFDFKGCKLFPNDLIKRLVETNNIISLNDIEYEYLNVLKEISRNKTVEQEKINNQSAINHKNSGPTVIVVPYKNRFANLKLFLRYIHPFLLKQNIKYEIFLVEPIFNNLTFNRGLLLNIGFVEANKYFDNNNTAPKPSCFIFHDVDMLPEVDKNLYSCSPSRPKQLAVAINTYGYSVDGYNSHYFGGVNAFTTEQFKNINGFSNLYFGWGAEDDDAHSRSVLKYKSVERQSPSVGRYFANCHQEQEKNSKRWMLLESGYLRMNKDGLNSLNYKVVKRNKKLLYTHILVRY